MRYYGKIHSKLPIFRVKSVKIYTGQKKFTREFSWLSWQISGMSISWIRFHHFSSKTIWSLISNAKTQACVPLDSKIKLVWWYLYHYQPHPNLTTESYTDRQAHAVLEVPVPAITTNCLGWKIFSAKYKNMEFLYWHDDLDV